MAPLKVIIIGGGLSGALLANGLLSNNIPFTIYERDSADSKREGYQIRMGPSAIIGFKACLPKDRLELITNKYGRSSGSTATAPAIYNTRWEEIIDLAVVPTYTKSASINRVILRDVLIEPIQEARRVRYEKTFERYSIIHDENGRQMVQVHFKDGTSDTCDILVGADGSNSQINAQVGARNIVNLDTHVVFVTKGDLTVDRLKQLPKRLLSGPVMLFKDGISFYYALYLPSSDGGELDDTAGNGQRNSGIEYDRSSASFYWGMPVPWKHIPYKTLKEIPDARQFLLDKMREWGWATELQDLIRSGSEDDNAKVEAIALRASKPLAKDWRENLKARADDGVQSDGLGNPRVWLMGDAIHAMQPNRGQGGNQALQDAADILPEILALNDIALSLEDGASLTETQIEQACRRYESAMFDRAFPWVRKSGGTSFPTVDFDGVLGTLAKLVSWTVLPVVRTICRVLRIGG